MISTRIWRRWGAIGTTTLTTALVLTACVNTKFKTNEPLHGFVIADEPRAAQIGRDMLADGGRAADAVTAMAMTMTATLPSRVGLGGGGVCLVFDATAKTTRTLDFLPRAPGGGGGGGTVAVPSLPRALAILHSTQGKLRWEKVLVPAEREALRGVQVSESLTRDVTRFGSTIPVEVAREWSGSAPVVRMELARTLSTIRQRGVGAFYEGTLGGEIAQATGIPAKALSDHQPRWSGTVSTAVDHYDLHFPVTAEGPSGDALMKAWNAGADADAGQRFAAAKSALGAAAAAQGGAVVPGATVMAIDGFENAVACALTMGAPFGTGRTVPGTGVMTAKPVHDLRFGAPALFTNAIVGRTRFGAVGASEGGDGPAAAALAMLQMALPGVMDEGKAPEILATRDQSVPGRIAAVTCQTGTENLLKACQPATDPRVPSLAHVIETDPADARER